MRCIITPLVRWPNLLYHYSSTGEIIKEIQSKFSAIGFNVEETSNFDVAMSQVVEDFQLFYDLEPSGVICDKTREKLERLVKEMKDDPKNCRIQGRVVDQFGNSGDNIKVVRFCNGLVEESACGSDMTDKKGHFSITYERQLGSRLSVSVKAYDDDGSTISESSSFCQLDAIKWIKLVIGGDYIGPTVFNKISSLLGKRLESEQACPSQVKEKTLQCILDQYNFTEETLKAFINSYKLNASLSLGVEFYFGLLLQNIEPQLDIIANNTRELLEEFLTNAIQANQISQSVLLTLDCVIEKLNSYSSQFNLENALTGEPPKYKDLLDEIEISDQAKKNYVKFISKYNIESKNDIDIWEILKSEGGLDNAEIDLIQKGIQFNQLTLNNPKLIPLFRKEKVESVRDLVKFTRDKWRKVLHQDTEAVSIVIPSLVLGENEKERNENYIKVMERQLERAFPTHYFMERLKEKSSEIITGQSDLVHFFDRHNKIEIELKHLDIDKFIGSVDTDTEGVEDKLLLINNLKSIKRLMKVSPNTGRVNTLLPLIRDGIDNSIRIANMGERFVSKYSEELGEENARAIYHRASGRSNILMNVVHIMHEGAVGLVPRGVNYFPSGEARDRVFGIDISEPPIYPPRGNDDGFVKSKTWEDLFGNTDFCSCEHCRSVYSPAAYMVDLLSLLEENDALDELLIRRPELTQIELSCENTNTLMPYIDLSNEILENAVSQTIHVYQTTLSEAELKSAPEHRNEDAYTILAESIYPWTLPLSLPHEEATRYLDVFNSNNHEVLYLFRDSGKSDNINDSNNDPNSIVRLSRAMLSITEVELNLLLNLNAPTLQEVWNYPISQLNSLIKDMNRLSLFINQSGIPYDRIIELVETRFIDSDGKLSLEGDCDLDTMEFSPPVDDVFLHRVHQFERLRLITQWTPITLDRVIDSLALLQGGRRIIDQDFIIHLAHLVTISKENDLEILEILHWWSQFDTRDYEIIDGEKYQSYYSKRFLDRSIYNGSTQANIFDFGSQNNITFLANIELASSALQTDENSIQFLVTTFSDNLNLETISMFARHVELSKLLEVNIQQLLVLIKLFTIDPFSDPRECYRFIKRYRDLAKYGITINTIESLLVSTPDLTATEQAGEWLDELQTRLSSTFSESLFFTHSLEGVPIIIDPINADILGDKKLGIDDPNGKLCETILRQILTDSEADRVIRLLQRQGPVNERVVVINELLKPIVSRNIKDTASLDTDIATLIDKLASANEISDRENRYKYLLPTLEEYRLRLVVVDKITEFFSEVVGLQVESVSELLSEYIFSTSETNDVFDPVPEGEVIRQRIIDDFVSDDIVKSTSALTADRNNTLLLNIIRIVKTLQIFSDLSVNFSDVQPLYQILRRLSIAGREVMLPFHVLPVEEITENTSKELFDQLEAFSRLVYYDRRLSSESFRLVESLANIENDSQDLINEFAEALGSANEWSNDDVKLLAQEPANQLGVSPLEDLYNGKLYERLHDIFNYAKKTDTSITKIVEHWLKSDWDFPGSNSIKSAVKAKYGDISWPNISLKINNELREVQRDALVAKVIADDVGTLNDVRIKNFKSKSDVYEYYLADAETNACMYTSRIKLALNSLQLFIQRILLGLEKNANLSSVALEKWEWLKNYRVWEANRKVFLYPENWLTPEFRDDKTSLFKDFETELLSKELTEKSIEGALRHYIVELEKVSKLEIMATYTEDKNPFRLYEKKIHHIFARTYDKPHQYYYQRWNEIEGTWTEWEEMDIDIDVEQIIPVVFKRRLMVFWPLFNEQKNENVLPGRSEERLMVAMKWATYDEGSWVESKFTTEGVHQKTVRVEENRLNRLNRLSGNNYSFRLLDGKQFNNLTIVGSGGLGGIDAIAGNDGGRAGPGRNYSLDSFVIECRLNSRGGGRGVILGYFVYNIKETMSAVQYDLAKHRFNGGDRGGVSCPPFTLKKANKCVEQQIVSSQNNKPISHQLVVFVEISTNSALDNFNRRVRILNKTPGVFKTTSIHQRRNFSADLPFAFEDREKSFLVLPKSAQLAELTATYSDILFGGNSDEDRVPDPSGLTHLTEPPRLMPSLAEPESDSNTSGIRINSVSSFPEFIPSGMFSTFNRPL